MRLAKEELETRADVFTHDALAWSLAAAGRWSDANVAMRQALAEGTRDARLFLHAGVIAAKLGDVSTADKYFQKAEATQQTLLPSERAQLRAQFTHLSPEAMRAQNQTDHHQPNQKGS